MNKQEVLKKLEQKKETILRSQKNLLMESELWGLYEARATTFMSAINIVEQLDEPQKVKVPEFVVEWFEENKHNLNFAIYELCEAGKVPVDLYEGLTDFERWFYLNHDIDTLIRMLDGYEVEEDPEWVVKRGLFYFEEFDSQMNGDKFGFNGDQRLAEAHHFSDKSKAEAVADLIGGEVKKV